MTGAVVRLLAAFGAFALIVSLSYAAGRRAALAGVELQQLQAEQAAGALSDSLGALRIVVSSDSAASDAAIARWERVRDSLTAFRAFPKGPVRVDTIVSADTLLVVDTIRVLVEAADAAVAECSLALNGCQALAALSARRQNADSLALRGLRAQLSAMQAAASRAGARAWRHRVEGGAACALSVWSFSQLSR